MSRVEKLTKRPSELEFSKAALLEKMKAGNELWIIGEGGLGDILLKRWAYRVPLRKFAEDNGLNPSEIKVNVHPVDVGEYPPFELDVSSQLHDALISEERRHYGYAILQAVADQLDVELPTEVLESVPLPERFTFGYGDTTELEESHPLSGFDLDEVYKHAAEFQRKYEGKHIYVIAQFGSESHKRFLDNQIDDKLIPTIHQHDKNAVVVVVSDRKMLRQALAQQTAFGFPQWSDELKQQVANDNCFPTADEVILVDDTDVNLVSGVFMSGYMDITSDSFGMHMAAGSLALRQDRKTGLDTGKLKEGDILSLFTVYDPKIYAPKHLLAVESHALQAAKLHEDYDNQISSGTYEQHYWGKVNSRRADDGSTLAQHSIHETDMSLLTEQVAKTITRRLSAFD